MHGPACPLSQTPIWPQRTNMKWNYMILLLFTKLRTTPLICVFHTTPLLNGSLVAIASWNILLSIDFTQNGLVMSSLARTRSPVSSFELTLVLCFDAWLERGYTIALYRSTAMAVNVKIEALTLTFWNYQKWIFEIKQVRSRSAVVAEQSKSSCFKFK